MVKEIGGMKVVLLMCLGTFVCMIDSTIMNITLPAIQDSLHTSLEKSTWMLNIYTMTIAVLAIPMARFAEMYGRNKFYLVGLFVFGLGSALCGLAESSNFLIGARFIQSFGASILIPCSMIIGIAAMPLEKRMIPQTLLGATQGLSTALGPTVGGIITQNLSWNWVFYVNVPICILAIIGIFMILPLKNENRIRAKIDWIGLLFSTAAIFPLNLVLIKGNAWGWGSTQAIVCYFVTMISIVLFILVEKKSAAPMVNLKLFKDRLFTGSVLIVTTGFIFLVGVTVLLPQFLTNFQHKTELQAAMLVTPISAAIFVFSNISGLVTRKIGYTLPVILGFGIMGIAYYLLHSLTIHSTSKEVILLGSLLGIGFSFVISSATIASSSSFEGELLTASQSVFSMLRQVGVVLAVAIFVAGLTNNIHQKKQDVIYYGKQKLETLDVPETAKAKILSETKKAINSESKAPKADTELVTKDERQQIIDQNVQETLAKIPEKQRAAARTSIYQKVEKQVDEDISKKEKSVKIYSTNVSNYAKTKIASSFGDLYKASIPFVLLCSLMGLIFRKTKSRGEIQALNIGATE
jgi:EmrB/QacA subfamily drug resistance transporter